MEWFQLGTFGWTGFVSAGWLWLDRATAAIVAGGMLATGDPWVVLDQSGFPIIPHIPELPTQLPTIPSLFAA